MMMRCNCIDQGRYHYYICSRIKDHKGPHVSNDGCYFWYDDERQPIAQYITTESLDLENTDLCGTVKMVLSEANDAEHLTHVDLIVKTKDAHLVILERIDTDKLRYMCKKAEEAKEI